MIKNSYLKVRQGALQSELCARQDLDLEISASTSNAVMAGWCSGIPSKLLCLVDSIITNIIVLSQSMTIAGNIGAEAISAV